MKTLDIAPRTERLLSVTIALNKYADGSYNRPDTVLGALFPRAGISRNPHQLPVRAALIYFKAHAGHI